MATRYAYQPDSSIPTAMARVEGVNASFKDLCNVCANVRGRRADAALEFLTEAADGDRPVRYFRFNKRRGHVGELGGKKGGWPVKSCKIVLNVLKNAVANANAKGMGTCKIAHIQANKQEVFGRMSPAGRRVRQDLETAFVEIVLRELQTPAGTVRKPAPKAETPKTESRPAAKAETQKAADAPKDASPPTAKIEEKKTETPAEKTEEPKTEANPVRAPAGAAGQ